MPGGGHHAGDSAVSPGAPLRVGAVVVSDGWKPESGDVNSAVPVDVVPLEADVDGFLVASGVPGVHTAHRPN